MRSIPPVPSSLRPTVAVMIFAAAATIAGGAPAPRADRASALTPQERKEEDLFFTPPGFDRVGEARWDGVPAWTSGGRTAEVQVVVRDAESGKITPCRVNVVGPDGHFYQPWTNRLHRYGLTGVYSLSGLVSGNRQGKAPYRYLGRFFYTPGDATVRVPAGKIRVEVWKGFEHRPETVTVDVAAGTLERVEVKLSRTASMAAAGYYAGDPHLHLPRGNDEEEQILFDLFEAEDFRYAVNMAWNNPAGPYQGFMDKQVYPQRSLGVKSIRTRGVTHLVSGQEYRNDYGHLNIVRDDIVLAGQNVNGDHWPIHGVVGRETMDQGGFAFMAHGGYGKEIYADAALGTIHGVELLQFGVYRDIGLENWYNILSSGYRFAAHGASDYPGTRWLADSRTYVYHPAAPTMMEWLAGVAAGRSFMTTGPLLLLEIDGEKPGAQLRKAGTGRHTVKARVRVRSEVTPVTNLDLIVNGRVAQQLRFSKQEGQGRWLEMEAPIELTESAWIAARAYSTSPGGFADAEAHTNPVYVYLNNRAPFQKAAIDAWIAKVDGQIAIHSKRSFPEAARVLNYFQQARDLLLRIRSDGGLAADVDPAKLLADVIGAAPGARSLALDAGSTDVTDEEIKAFLKPVPPTTVEQALRMFETVGGFEMQIVAAEPQIRSPIAAAFDENGNLYVAEMTDYPYNPRGRVKVAWQREFKPGEEPIGSVRLLRDTDGDGKFDRSTVFADKLLWAGGITPWKGGVYVTAPPDIWYFKDTDGDGVADLKQKVFTGFGSTRQQQFLNSIQFGLDHRIYGSTGGNGGEIVPASDPTARPVSVNGRDFRFTPDTHVFEPQTGTQEFGMSFDDWGNRFLCDQSNAAFHVVLPLHYLERNPYFSAPDKIYRAAPQPTPLFRISPIERWRFIKSSRRVAGTERQADISAAAGLEVGLGTQRVGARPAGVAGVSNYVVDATAGITIYRGGAYPKEYYGSLFIGDSLANCVHRRVFVEAGATFRTERGDPNTEFVRTADNWFRPVNFVNAPDGTLYCIDMAREHSESANIPPDVEKHMDLTSGRDRGRIYRMAPPGFRPPPPPRLGSAGTAELVDALESPHGWWRDTAHRLIFERQDKSAVPALQRLAVESARPQTRLHALWSLEGLGALREREILAGLGDAHAGVRENAVRLAEPRLETSSALREKVSTLLDDPGPRVRLQVAFTLGQSRQWSQPQLLARMAGKNLDDSWIQSAIVSSAVDCGGELFALAVADAAFLANARAVEFLRKIARFVGFQNREKEVAHALAALAPIRNPEVALTLLSALGEGLKLAGTSLAQVDRAGATRAMLREAPAIVRDDKRSDAERRAATAALGLLPYAEAAPALTTLLGAKQPAAFQVRAIEVLEEFTEPAVGTVLLENFAGLAATAKVRALDVLLKRTERVHALLDALGGGRVSRSDLSAKHIAALRQHGDDRVRERTADVLGAVNPAMRRDVIRSYLPALEMPGDAARGRTIFQSRCAVCHQMAGVGLPFGPDLSGVSSGGKEKLLSSILDPNRDVAAQYFMHTVVTKSGDSTGGILKNENSTAITLLQVGGVERVIPRANIAETKTLRQSLMPEGLEGGLTVQDMSDLIEFLVNPGQ